MSIALIFIFIADCVKNRGRKVLPAIGEFIVSSFRLVIGTEFSAPMYERQLIEVR